MDRRLAVRCWTTPSDGSVPERAQLTTKSLLNDGAQDSRWFSEMGGKAREILVRHDLEQFLRAYIEAFGITEVPLFRPAYRRTKELTARAMSGKVTRNIVERISI